MWILGVFSLGDTLESVFVNILLFLDSIVYGLICSSFRIFTAVAGARLLSSDVYTSIANKIYIIVGVVMLFVLAYAIIRAIIDPDQMTKGDLSGPKILKNVVVAVIGLAIAPVLFNMMYQAQSLFLEHDVLVKLFFRTDQENVNLGNDIGTVYPNQEIDRVGGAVTAVSLWTAFFYPDVDSGATMENISANPSDYYVSVAAGVTCGVLAVGALVLGGLTFGLGTLLLGAAAGAVCAGVATEVASSVDLGIGDEINLAEAYNVASTTGDFGLFSLFTSFVAEGQIKYIGFVSTICGGFVCYAFISFTIDMGVRAAKLAYYQIIAPIPLILQVLPKWKDTFSKYLREVINTFIEVFVRISVVYIIIYIICHLGDLFGNMAALFGNKDLSGFEATLAYALLIIGLVIFAKQAPKLISETFGLKSGSMSLGIGKKLAEGGAYTAGAAIGGGITSGVRNFRARHKDFSEAKGFKNKARALGKVASSTIGGAGSGFIRSGWAAKGAKSVGDMKKSATSGINAAVDARNKRDDKRKELEARAADHEEIRKLDRELAEANERLNNAVTDAEKAAIQKEINTLNSDRKRLMATGRVLAKIDDGIDAVDRWSAGTVDLSKEEADIKFAESLKKINDAVREEAYKKDNPTKGLKQIYDELMKKDINKYRDGWSVESYNAAINSAFAALENERSRIATNSETARIAKEQAEADLLSARSAGADASEIRRLETAFQKAERDLADKERVRNAFEADLANKRKQTISEIDSIAKLDDNELMKANLELQEERKLAKDRYEAAADAYVIGQASIPGSDVSNVLSAFMAENADYISKNASRSITVKIDANGNEEQRTISDIVTKAFGAGAVNGKINHGQLKNGNKMIVDGVEYEISVLNDAKGTIQYNRTDSSGNVETYSAKDFSDIIQKARVVETETKVNAASKTGKEASKVIRQTASYQDKVTRKRKADEGKK